MTTVLTTARPSLFPASVLLATPRPAWQEEFAHYAASFAFSTLAPQHRAQAKLIVLDCLGAIAAGMQEPENRSLARRLAARGGGAAAAIGAGLTLRGDDAAFVNGVAATALELDEGNSFARGHPGVHVLPAALAAALAGDRSGHDFLSAFVMGYEIAARIGAACRLRPGVHPHGTWGTIGAAIAGALLDRAGPAEIVTTLNVAATMSVGASLTAMLEGATARNAYCGLSNRNGLAAWDLVASGFTGERDCVASVYDGILGEGFTGIGLTDGLGERFEMSRNYFKRHAACRFTHAALDVVTALLAGSGPIAPEDVEAIEVETYAMAAQLDAPRPPTVLAARFSLPFAIATTLVNGQASVEAFRPPHLTDPAILALAAKVRVVEDPALTARLPAERPARVRLRFADGRMLAGETFTNRGDAADPFTPQDVRAKFRDLASPVWGAHAAQRLEAVVETLDTAADLKGLNGLLAAPRDQGPSRMGLKTLLAGGPAPIVAPGIYDALTGSIATDAGFPALYLSGAAIAYTRLGRPDIGLVAMTEVADTIALIRQRVDTPIIVDADNGYGNALNVQRTVRTFERAGASAIQLEDQTLPKRCGHLSDKALVAPAEMVGKVKAAVDARRSDETLIIARTDAVAVEGFEAALERAALYAEAGADALFVEAPRSAEQLEAVCKALGSRLPLLANMVEGGNTPLYTAAELGAMGYSIVIFPGGIVRALARTAQAYYASLRAHGTNTPFAANMFQFGELNELIGTPAMLADGQRYEDYGIAAVAARRDAGDAK